MVHHIKINYSFCIVLFLQIMVTAPSKAVDTTLPNSLNALTKALNDLQGKLTGKKVPGPSSTGMEKEKFKATSKDLEEIYTKIYQKAITTEAITDDMFVVDSALGTIPTLLGDAKRYSNSQLTALKGTIIKTLQFSKQFIEKMKKSLDETKQSLDKMKKNDPEKTQNSLDYAAQVKTFNEIVKR
ncbi:unnamed protein product, partial [marine sediment metagenome]